MKIICVFVLISIVFHPHYRLELCASTELAYLGYRKAIMNILKGSCDVAICINIFSVADSQSLDITWNILPKLRVTSLSTHQTYFFPVVSPSYFLPHKDNVLDNFRWIASSARSTKFPVLSLGETRIEAMISMVVQFQQIFCVTFLTLSIR